MSTLKTSTMSRFFIMVVLSLIGLMAYSQDLKENYIDEMTGDTIKYSHWRTIRTTLMGTIYSRFKSVNSTYGIEIRMMLGQVFSISEGDCLILKLDNGELIKLGSPSFVLTSIGGGSTGLSGSGTPGLVAPYLLDNESCIKLASNTITRIRICTSNGIIDWELGKGLAESIQADVGKMLISKTTMKK